MACSSCRCDNHVGTGCGPAQHQGPDRSGPDGVSHAVESPFERILGPRRPDHGQLFPDQLGGPDMSDFPRSPSMASSRTARTSASSRRTARSSGCACLGPTRRACSEPCSIARRARSGSGRRTPWCPISAGTYPAPWWSRPPGIPRPAGWSSRICWSSARWTTSATFGLPPRPRRLAAAGVAAPPGPVHRRQGRGRWPTACRCSSTAPTPATGPTTARVTAPYRAARRRREPDAVDR